MGSYKNFRKRQKSKKDLVRSSARQREPYDSVLIVCEGEKTEPNYFKGLIRSLRINTANVAVTSDCGTDPRSIFRHAKAEHKKSDESGNPFDRVYCVFDRDSHTNFYQTINEILNHDRGRGIFIPCCSIPSFEFWYLLHYEHTTKPYERTEKKSASDLVEKDLRNHLPNYKKKSDDMYIVLREKRDEALRRSKKIYQKAVFQEDDNPCTAVHILVHDLITIQDGK